MRIDHVGVIVTLFFVIRCNQFSLFAANALGSCVRAAIVIFLWQAVDRLIRVCGEFTTREVGDKRLVVCTEKGISGSTAVSRLLTNSTVCRLIAARAMRGAKEKLIRTTVRTFQWAGNVIRRCGTQDMLLLSFYRPGSPIEPSSSSARFIFLALRMLLAVTCPRPGVFQA